MEVQMQRTSRVWKWIAVVGVLAVGSGIVSAQGGSVSVMTAERSWQIQSVLQSIDADRESWVNLLVSKFASTLNPATYDAAAEIAPVARVAPAWQVYGASLAPDYLTAVQVLRGQQSAGQYILGPSESGSSAQVAAFELAPQSFGGFTAEMVYNTVSPPCRVVDTRNAGARTGPILPNQTRSFDLTTEAETDGQGGGPFPCPGLPSFHFQGWALNITVLGNGPYTTHGGLKQWPFTGPEPNASVINWTPGLNGAIANGIIATACPGCADSIMIKNFGADPSHVIIDVMGYFSAASVANGVVFREAGTPVSVPGTNNTGTVNGAACPAGSQLVGGDVEHAATGPIAISSSGQLNATQWTFKVYNNTGSAVNVTGFSRCVENPIKFN
jgi:hypothetical protein